MTLRGPDVPFSLARFTTPTGPRPALVVGERLRPLSAVDLGGHEDVIDYLAEPDWDHLAHLAASDGPWRSLDDVELTSPVSPRHVFQAGANYRTHVVQLIMAEMARRDDGRTPEEVRADAEKVMDARAASGSPFIFLGLSGCVVGPNEPLVLPAGADTHDWELELAAVIGREAFKVEPGEALSYVAGYTIVNDITTREYVFPGDIGGIGADWFRSKNAPGFLPTGPFLVPAPFVDPSDLLIELQLNGEVMQQESTAELVFDTAAIIAAASQTTRLLPGDLILTGSPSGNGQHWGRFLRDGDVMTGSITHLGTQVVRCVAESTVGAQA